MPDTKPEKRSRPRVTPARRLLGAAWAAWKAHRDENDRGWSSLAADQARNPTLA